MENARLSWVICLTLVLVVVLNISIYVALKGKKTQSMADVLRRFTKGVRNPWEAEDAALSELSDLVAGLKRDNHVEREKDE